MIYGLSYIFLYNNIEYLNIIFNIYKEDKQNENIKQLIKYTNDDIDILKEKNVSLEHSMNVLRADLLKNVNEFEGFLSKKYDSLYRIVNHHTC